MTDDLRFTQDDRKKFRMMRKENLPEVKPRGDLEELENN